MVENTLYYMVRRKNPTATHHNETCDECLRDHYLFGIHDDGIGNKRLGLLIRIDQERKGLYPVAVYRASPQDNAD